MAPESSRAVVLPNFDMHIYTSDLTSSKLKAVVNEYCIPLDLHPRLPPPGMTMNRLPSRYIGLYVEQLEQGGLRIPFSSFFLVVIRHFGVHVSQLVSMGVNRVILFKIRCLSLYINPTVSLFRVFYKLCKQGHWFSFENKTGRGTRKCFKEVTMSLKGWKRKFFLLDRRAIPDAMPWRHGDIDLHDDLPANYNENDVARLSEFLVPLRPPPRHLLYVCGLTTACRHPDLRYDIKDQDKNVISMDTFLKLPTWIETVVSKGDPIPEDQRPKPRVTPPLPVGFKLPELTAFQKNLEKPNPKIVAAREKKEQLNLAKAEAKRVGTGGVEGPRKKQRVQKQSEPTQSGSKETLSATPLHQAIPEAAKKPVAVIAPEVTKDGSYVEKEVVDLSGNTRVSTPLAVAHHPSPLKHHGANENIDLDGNEDELVSKRYVPNWGLRNDLCVCTYRACRELISHLATPTEDEFLASLSNAKVISRAYQTLGESAVAQGELLKRHEEKELLDRVKDLERERDEWRETASDQVEKIRCLEKDLELRTQQLVAAEERVGVLEGEKLAFLAELAQAEANRKKLVNEFIPTVIKKLHTSVEYRKSLATPVQLCFTAGWLGGLSLGKTEDEIAQFLSETEDLDIEGSK
ncbi:hypothetical protein Tco_0498940 [Tanacetum coccineum]